MLVFSLFYNKCFYFCVHVERSHVSTPSCRPPLLTGYDINTDASI